VPPLRQFQIFTHEINLFLNDSMLLLIMDNTENNSDDKENTFSMKDDYSIANRYY